MSFGNGSDTYFIEHPGEGRLFVYGANGASDVFTTSPGVSRVSAEADYFMRALNAKNTEIGRLRAALNAIRDVTGARQDQPWAALSRIDQIARKGLLDEP